jgi:hypothetical protein
MNLFRALITFETDSSLASLRRLSSTLDARRQPEAFIACLDNYFHDFSRITMSCQEDVLVLLDSFLAYAHAIYTAVMEPSPWASQHMQLLLGVLPQPSEDDLGDVVLQRDTLLWDSHVAASKGSASDDVSNKVSRQRLKELIQSTLSHHLHAKIEQELCAVIQFSTLLYPCEIMSLQGSCTAIHPEPVAHSIDARGYNNRVSFHMQQIQILHISHQLLGSDFPARMRDRRFVLLELFRPVI